MTSLPIRKPEWTRKRCITLLLAVIVLSIPLVAMRPQSAHAQLGCAGVQTLALVKSKIDEGVKTVAPSGLPVKDIAVLSATTKTAKEASIENTVRCVLDGLAWTAAKVALKSMTQSVVNWINSGFEGSPAFVTDLNRNLGNLADAVAEDFLRGLDQVAISNTGFSIRAPFQDQINAALREEFYRTTSSYGFDIRHPYRDCYGGRGFSISGFFCESQDPANNPYGRYQLARNELFATIDNAAQNRIRELGWGKGFLSWRGPCGPFGTQAAAGVDLSQKDTTAKCPIRTPGAVIENALGISATSPFRQLELADSVNEIVSALMTQMVSQVLGGGGLVGLSQPTAGGGRSFIDQVGTPTEYAGIAGVVSTDIEKARQLVVDYQSSWQKIATAAQNAQNACSNDSTKAGQARTVLTRAQTALTRAASALAAIANAQSQVTAAQNAATANPDAPKQAVDAFLALLGDATVIPTDAALEEADRESQDTGSEEPGSLYSQMVRLAASCR